MNKTAAILGANSYIGRNLTALLQKQKRPFQLYDRDAVHKDGCIPYRQIDLLDADSLAQIDFTADTFYFFTGLTGTTQGFEDYALYLDVNEKMLLAFLTAYRAHNAHGKIVFLSSRLVYKGSEFPLREEDEKQFKTIYAVNKFACEQYLALYGELFGVSYCILRLCVPYGTSIPGAASYGTLGFFERQAAAGKAIPLYGDGSLRRTFTHMDDLCEILCRAAECPACSQEVFNIGGQALSLRQAAETVAARYGVGIALVDWPPEALKLETGHTVFNSDKLDSLLHYSYKSMA